MKISKVHLLIAIFLFLGLILIFSKIQMKHSQEVQTTEAQLSPKKDVKKLENGFVMAYLFNDIVDPNPNEYFSQSVNQAGKSINEVSPPYLNLNQDGGLEVSNEISSAFIKKMHKSSITVVPFLSDQWDKNKAAAALKNKKKLVFQISNVVEENDLDGVNVDIEHITKSDRENYTRFVKQLRAKLPKEKKITVAVAANPNGWTEGWHGAYDDAALAKYSDYLMLMAYDEHAQDDKKSGPVASLPFVRKSIEYILSQDVPADKVVLGIPFYGRLWDQNGTINGLDVSMKMAEKLIKKYHGKVVYDEDLQSPRATFTIKKKDDRTRLEKWDITLKPGKYTLWYENEASLKAKLKLVKKYHLKGTGIWSLGQETENTWDYYKQTQNPSQK